MKTRIMNCENNKIKAPAAAAYDSLLQALYKVGESQIG